MMPIHDWSQQILIFEAQDEPLFTEDMDALHRRIDDGEAEGTDVIVNMKAVTFLNSSNIAQLLRLRKKLISAEQRLRICAVCDQVWSMLLITGLDKVFDFTDDVSTSLASLQIER